MESNITKSGRDSPIAVSCGRVIGWRSAESDVEALARRRPRWPTSSAERSSHGSEETGSGAEFCVDRRRRQRITTAMVPRAPAFC